MRNVVAAAALLFAATYAFADASRSSHFGFQIPEGWTDKSTADMRSFYTFAVEREEHLVFQAKVQPGGEAVNAALLDKYAGDAEKSVAKHMPGTQFKVLKKELVKFRDLTVGRFVFETVPPGSEATALRQLQFYLPVADQHAILTFTAPRETFDQFVPLFDQTARATVIKR